MNAREVVRPGDTLVSLSARLLGDPLRWGELVSLNHLKPPYLTATGAPGTLRPGDEILYPLTAGAPPPQNIAQLEEETYGRDLADDNGDLILRGGNLVTLAGLPNLRAALLRRLRVRLGAHPFHPAYGSNVKNHLGRPADDARLIMLIDDVVRSVLRDPRVQDATGEAVWEHEVLTVVLDVTPVPPGTPFTLRVPVTS